MDRRSWLWRRKSSDKSPAKTDSSGSFSSHSERFSDDQVYPTHKPQSPKLTSKAASGDGEISDELSNLTEKLSAALLNNRAKEDLVKQHAKVAEEAVSGWEKAEKELSSLKQQLEAAAKNNSVLENRVGHLDAALKECVRQLRQAREDQEQRTNEALSLQTQLQTAQSQATASVESDLRQKLEDVEKDNSYLKHQLLSHAKELEIRTVERDLSTQVAEMASKQHLKSIKKVAKLEAECRWLRTIARKFSPANDHKSMAALSIYVESLTDSQSDCGERLLVAESDARKIVGLEVNECEPICPNSWASAIVYELDQFNNQKTVGRNLILSSVEMDLMDDFLEMERLAALHDIESGSSYVEAAPLPNQVNCVESSWEAKYGAMIHKTVILEERLEKLEEEKVETQNALVEWQRQVETCQSQLKEADAKLIELQLQLSLCNEEKRAREKEMESIKCMREAAEAQLLIVESENKSLVCKVDLVEAEVEKERALSAETAVKCQKLQDELSKWKRTAELQYEDVESFNKELKIKQEKELAVAASKYAECQKTVSSLHRQLTYLATMEECMVEFENSSDLTGEGLNCLGGRCDKYVHNPIDITTC